MLQWLQCSFGILNSKVYFSESVLRQRLHDSKHGKLQLHLAQSLVPAKECSMGGSAPLCVTMSVGDALPTQWS